MSEASEAHSLNPYHILQNVYYRYISKNRECGMIGEVCFRVSEI